MSRTYPGQFDLPPATPMDNQRLFRKEEYECLFEFEHWVSKQQVLHAVVYPLAYECNGYDIADYLSKLTDKQFCTNDSEEITLNGKVWSGFDDSDRNYDLIKRQLAKLPVGLLCGVFRIKHIFPSKPVDFSLAFS